MRFLLVAAVTLFGIPNSFAADRPGSELTPQSPVVLYHFVRGAARLSRHADELDQNGGSGKSLRSAFSETIGLSESDTRAFFAFAATVEAQFAAFDQQAADAIAKATAESTATGSIPPPPPELTVLQKQKEALMGQLGSLLAQSSLSDDGKAAVRHYMLHAAAHTNPVNNR